MDFLRKHLLALGLFIALTLLVVASLVEFSGDPGKDDPAAADSSAGTPHTFVAASGLSPREADHLPHGVIVTDAGTGSGSRSPEATYVGIANCKSCHGPGGIGGDKWTGWNQTKHGLDFTKFDYRGQTVNKLTLYGGACKSCHVVGYNQTDIGGYDPAQEWNSTNNIELIGIQCESCHGPGSEHNGNPAGILGAPTIEQSCYGTAEAGCHGPSGHDKYTPWNESKHARSLDKGFVANNPRCAQCHSREIFSKEIEGEDHEGEVGTNPIDCALCHDPHDATNEDQLRLPEEELCVQCHTTETEGEAEPGHTVHHPQAEMNQGVAGSEVLGGVGMAGVQCVDCHMYNTPEVGHNNPITDTIGGELHESHTWEPTAWACASCHSNTMSSKLPAQAKPANDEGDNETLWNEWEDFETEWEAEVEKYDRVIEAWQESTQQNLDRVELLLAQVDANITSAEENGTVSAEKLAQIREVYNESLWNYQMVNADGSRGVHNFDFGVVLLADANQKANEAERMLAMALAPKENVPPIAVAGTSQLGKLNDTFTFNASNSQDKDGTIVSYEWDFGDGTQATGVTSAHKYLALGQYVVTLTVTDEEGVADSDIISVFVIEEVPDLTGLEQKTNDLDQKTNELDNELAVKADKDDLSSKVGTGGLIVVLVVALVAVGASFMMVRQELEGLKDELKRSGGQAVVKEPKEVK